jgi:hypothetical protein
MVVAPLGGGLDEGWHAREREVDRPPTLPPLADTKAQTPTADVRTGTDCGRSACRACCFSTNPVAPRRLMLIHWEKLLRCWGRAPGCALIRVHGRRESGLPLRRDGLRRVPGRGVTGGGQPGRGRCAVLATCRSARRSIEPRGPCSGPSRVTRSGSLSSARRRLRFRNGWWYSRRALSVAPTPTTPRWRSPWRSRCSNAGASARRRSAAPLPTPTTSVVATGRAPQRCCAWFDRASTRTMRGLGVRGEGSLRNGAAMRVAPVALATPRRGGLLEAAGDSAWVPHAHPLAVDAAVAQATAIAAAPVGKAPLDAALAAATAAELRGRLSKAVHCSTAARSPPRPPPAWQPSPGPRVGPGRELLGRWPRLG